MGRNFRSDSKWTSLLVGLVSYSMRKLLVCGNRRLLAGLAAVFIYPLFSFAEVANDPAVLELQMPCPAYEKYLAVSKFNEMGACTNLEQFILKDLDQGYLEFLKDYHLVFPEQSGLALLYFSVEHMIRRDAVRGFLFFDVADRQIFHDLMRAGDVQRAVFYSGLISKVKVSILNDACRSNSHECEFQSGTVTPSEVLGLRAARLDAARQDLLLLCMVRSDAFSAPLIQVALSARVLSCLAQEEVE